MYHHKHNFCKLNVKKSGYVGTKFICLIVHSQFFKNIIPLPFKINLSGKTTRVVVGGILFVSKIRWNVLHIEQILNNEHTVGMRAIHTRNIIEDYQLHK